MYSRIAFAALFVASTMPLAFAQSASSTNFTTKPVQALPAPRNSQSNDSGNTTIPPAARSGEKGLRVGPGAMQDDQFVTIKRNK